MLVKYETVELSKVIQYLQTEDHSSLVCYVALHLFLPFGL